MACKLHKVKLRLRRRRPAGGAAAPSRGCRPPLGSPQAGAAPLPEASVCGNASLHRDGMLPMQARLAWTAMRAARSAASWLRMELPMGPLPAISKARKNFTDPYDGPQSCSKHTGCENLRWRCCPLRGLQLPHGRDCAPAKGLRPCYGRHAMLGLPSDGRDKMKPWAECHACQVSACPMGTHGRSFAPPQRRWCF